MSFFLKWLKFADFRIVGLFLLSNIGLSIKCTAWGSRQIPSVNLESEDRKRFLALMLLNLSRERGIDADLITLGHNSGMNAVYLTIPWNYVYYESPTEPPNWAKYDEQIAIATSLGMKVAIRIHLGRHSSRLKGFWELKDSPHDWRNTPLLAGYGDTYFRFNYDPALQKALAFVKEVTERYQFLQKENNLVFVSVTNTNEQEGGYSAGVYYEDKQVPTIYDYSPEIINGFRTWLRDNYGKIERLNLKWGINHKSFEEPYPPSAPWDPNESFARRYGKDWYIYRHLHLREFVEKMIGAVKSVDSTIKYVGDYGSVFDGISGCRGTLGFKDLHRRADGIKVNDDLNGTDHRFSVDILRSQSPPHFLVANEVFISDWGQNFEYIKQVDENFQNGADLVAVVVGTIPSMQKAEPFIRDISSRLLKSPVTPVTYADTVSYLLSEAVDKGSATRVVYNLYAAKAYADPKNPKPVYINLQEDLFTEDYWKGASNQKPIVSNPLKAQTIAVNRNYKFKIPDGIFTDPDGRIAQVEASNLPDWLTYKDGYLLGIPKTLGSFHVTIKGIDDEGASGSALLIINVIIPEIRFEMISGSSDKRVVTILNGGEQLAYGNIPSLINITATSNFDFETIHFDLKGPYSKKTISSTAPHSLIGSIYGFRPVTGHYNLTAQTQSGDVNTASKTIAFTIFYGDSSDVSKNIVALQFYPNPVESVINVKIPDTLSKQDLKFVLIHTSGKAVTLSSPHVTIRDNLANIDLAGAGVQAGTYILQLKTKQALVKQFKLYKY